MLVKLYEFACVLNLSQAEVLKEARIMAALDNPYIIRMIGLCRSEWMLILEYAALGPLKDFLRRHRRSAIYQHIFVCDVLN